VQNFHLVIKCMQSIGQGKAAVPLNMSQASVLSFVCILNLCNIFFSYSVPAVFIVTSSQLRYAAICKIENVKNTKVIYAPNAFLNLKCTKTRFGRAPSQLHTRSSLKTP